MSDYDKFKVYNIHIKEVQELCNEQVHHKLETVWRPDDTNDRGEFSNKCKKCGAEVWLTPVGLEYDDKFGEVCPEWRDPNVPVTKENWKFFEGVKCTCAFGNYPEQPCSYELEISDPPFKQCTCCPWHRYQCWLDS